MAKKKSDDVLRDVALRKTVSVDGRTIEIKPLTVQGLFLLSNVVGKVLAKASYSGEQNAALLGALILASVAEFRADFVKLVSEMTGLKPDEVEGLQADAFVEILKAILEDGKVQETISNFFGAIPKLIPIK